MFLVLFNGAPAAHGGTVYSDDFSGAGNLNGTAPDTRPGGETWSASIGGTAWMADGTIAPNGVDRWAFLPFEPTAGKIYTLSLEVNPTSGVNRWFGLAFAGDEPSSPGNPPDDENAFFDAAPWMLQRADRSSSSEIQTYLQATTFGENHIHGIAGVVPLTIVLNTHPANWTAEWFVDDVSIRGPIAYATNPTIEYVGFGRDETAGGTVANFRLTVINPGTIDTTDRFAWGENVGWTNWRWDTGTPGEGATIGQFFCGGLIWGENVGWIDLGDGAPGDGIEYANTDAADFGVNHDGAGGLSGLAWGENIGWITFGQGVTDPPRIDFATGKFSGYVYGENIGWIDLGSNGTHFVRTNTIDAGPDTDGDMLADAWELEQAMAAGLGAVLTHLDTTTDSDGDGESDFDEYLADSDPFDALDALRIVDFGVISGGTEFPGPGPITINDNTTATPYPSTIAVSGVSGTVTAVRVKLDGFSHTYPDSVDVFLVGPGGEVSAVLSDAGLSTPVVNVDLVFDDAAGTVIPDSTAITSGTYSPANYEAGEPLPPGGTGVIGTNLTALAGGGANGDWKLFVSEDDAFGDTGSITSWSVVIEIGADDITLEWTSSPRRLYDLGSSTDLDPFTVDFSNLAPDPGPTTAIIFNDPLVPRKYWRVGAKLPR